MAETKPLLVEIGTEELPPKALQQLAVGFRDALTIKLQEASLLGPEAAQVYFSPRRLAVLVPNLNTLQADRDMERSGPALTAAFDKSGAPTKAAEGFARSCGTEVSKLQQRDGKLFFKTTVKGRTATDLLPELVNDALARLPIPKRMRWGAGEAQFVRPVHWVVMLLGKDVVPAEILGIQAGRTSYGHRYMHPEAVVLHTAGEYLQEFDDALSKTRVLVDSTDGRLRRRIADQVRSEASKCGGIAVGLPINPDENSPLLSEIAALVEWPEVMTGSFDPRFLALPEEVLIITLEHHQRYFPLRAKQGGKLLPKFIFVSNIKSAQPYEVRRGNERVIAPRLQDAAFFWELDRKTSLAARIPELDRVVFQKQLGSYGDKARRVAKLSGLIAGQLGADLVSVQRAATLAKCDLLSNLVGEFPELQGTMGRYFAAHDGESEAVAQAIEEQYLPRFAGDRLPQSKLGQALAIADKLDTVCGIFAIGQAPSGDKDPFALRRQALGVLRIIIECRLELDIAKLVEFALAQFAPPTAQDELLKVLNFFVERLRAYYWEQGIRKDVFEAVMAREIMNPSEFDRRITGMQAFMQLPEAANLAAANKRIANILRQADTDTAKLDPSLFETSAEISLLAAINSLDKEIAPFLKVGDYTAVLTRLAALRTPVDGFFEKVMVLAEDATQRGNRLALLGRLQGMFLQIADLSRIQVE